MTNTIANTILEQMGGNKFLAMTGAKVSFSKDSLTLKLPSMSKVKVFVVKYNTMTDMYEVSTFSKSLKQTVVGSDVGCDQLIELFEQVTGMYTYL